MRKFSDYKGEEALDLWMDLLDPITEIMADKSIGEMRDKNRSDTANMTAMAKELIKGHKKEVETILLRIDPTPLTGLNILTRLISLVNELTKSEDAKDFFGIAEETETPKEYSGPVMENTGADAK